MKSDASPERHVCRPGNAARQKGGFPSMAAPQFFTPGSVRPSRPKRRFTLAQANSALPLVKRIVGDIVRVHEQAVKIQAELEQLEPMQRSTAQTKLEQSMTRLEDFVD